MTTKFLNTTTALCLSLTAALGAAAQAQTGLSIDIDAQHMVDAVAELGETAGIQIIGANELLNGKISVPVRGESDPMRALELMLNDPTLAVSGLSDGTLIVAPVGGANTVSQNAQNEVPFVLPPIIFRSDRSAQPIGDIPRAVKNIDAIELRQTLNKTTNFSAGLSELIPGFSPSVFQNSTRGLTLRGREPLYLLDGIPLSNGQFGVTLQFIDSEAIENIEVLYGPTALYGNGATGGVIQFFTKDPTEDPLLRFSTGVATSLASGSEFDGDGFTYRVAGEARGRADRFGYVAIASYESNGAQFDPDGNRIGPTRLDDFDDYAFFGKLTYDIGDTSTIEALVNFTQSAAVDTDFASILAPGARSATTVFPQAASQKNRSRKACISPWATKTAIFWGPISAFKPILPRKILCRSERISAPQVSHPFSPVFFKQAAKKKAMDCALICASM